MALNQVFDQIRPFPESHAIYREDVRRAKVGRTPYNLYYRILADRIEVVAVIHGRRDPKSWQHRV